MEITYKTNVPLTATDVADVFTSSGIIRPVQDLKRIELMFANANLVISAWEVDRLVGVARSLTDFEYCCYLSDLAVRKEYQKSGIGKKLVELTQQHIGEKVMLLLLSAPGAMEYYPKIGFQKVQNGFIINRKV